MTIYESSSKHNILMSKTFFSFSISHCTVSALIDCFRRPNTSLPSLNTRSIPTSTDRTGRKSRTEPSRGVHFPPLQHPFRQSQLTGGKSIYLSISEAMIVGRLDFAEGLSYPLRALARAFNPGFQKLEIKI
jgi:hypothetical protein